MIELLVIYSVVITLALLSVISYHRNVLKYGIISENKKLKKDHNFYIKNGFKYYHWRGIRYFYNPDQFSLIKNSNYDKYFEGKSYAKNEEDLRKYLEGKAITLIWFGEIQ